MNLLDKIKNVVEKLEKLPSLSENEALQLVSYIKEIAYAEQGDDSINFFNDEEKFQKLIALGDKFSSNEDLLEEIVSVLGIQTRFINYFEMFDLNYDFLFKHKLHNNKKYDLSFLHIYTNFLIFKIIGWEMGLYFRNTKVSS